MKMLFDERLSGRGFGSDVISVSSLKKLIETKGYLMPVDLQNYEVAQVEYLLDRIANNASGQSTEHAAARISRNQTTEPQLAAMCAGMESEASKSFRNHIISAPHFLDGASAADQWRAIFRDAFGAGELLSLDCISFLPVAKPAPAAEVKAEVETKQGLTKGAVIGAFNGLNFDRDQWARALANVPKWLIDCRLSQGSPGRKVSATWNPVLIAVALYGKKIPIRKLDAVFISLKDWADEWREVSATFRD